MRRLLFGKFREALASVLPVTLIVLLFSFTPLFTLTGRELLIFCGAALFLALGIGLFTLGADVAMTPMGTHVGSGLTKSQSSRVLLVICFALGVFVTVAEPDLTVLAGQVGSKAIILFVGLGVGLFLVLAVLKILTKTDLGSLLVYFYMLLFALALFLLTVDPANARLLPLSFDAGGVTTGPITVPFIMALGVGIATTVGGRKASENSFGLVALCSIGPIAAVLLLCCFSGGAVTEPATDGYLFPERLGPAILSALLDTARDVTLALGLVVLFFFAIDLLFLKLPRVKLLSIGAGVALTYVGLILFLTAVTVGFMPVGFRMGKDLAACSRPMAVAAGFLLGLVVVLAEPAVHVLNKQVEEVTNGAVSKTAMLVALSVGVALSIGLSILRILFGFSVLWYLIPGYLLSLGLSFFVPKLYTAIAFDAGGVASGPLTSTFILPFAIGACVAVGGDILADGFGIVAMVAMTPLITIQTLGFTALSKKRVNEKLAMKRILGKDDDEIIRFR